MKDTEQAKLDALKRSDQFLLLIEASTYTTREGFDLYYSPGEKYADAHFQLSHTGAFVKVCNVGGGADVSAINSLVKRGLVEVVMNDRIRMGWKITDAGKVRAQTLL